MNASIIYPNNTYTIDGSEKWGIGLVLVNEKFTDKSYKRKGAQKEIGNLKLLLDKEFSLEMFNYQDLSFQNIKELLSSLSGKIVSDVYPSIEDRHQIVVIAISSHGADDYILTSDMERITLSEITSYFNPELCKRDMPKLFIFNACRKYKETVAPKEAWADDECIVPPEWPNFITLCLCQRGTPCYRSIIDGSLAIRELCESFRSYGREIDFVSFLNRFTPQVECSILQITTEKGDPRHQCPIYKSTSQMLLYFPKQEIVPSDRMIPHVMSVPRTGIGTSEEEEMEREEESNNFLKIGPVPSNSVS
ncbi:Caspase-6 isoform X2 [Oopsacas minuta]|uniref:Caspase-6 isoform X2 n=1 Tax=Oopsacas minuta TaxID=111878 RepID=A0AAV7K0S2_9METZ|nr:Caspase-6 isoform X2 [Oopsacas minuta]